jgi:hypothetical protein
VTAFLACQIDRLAVGEQQQELPEVFAVSQVWKTTLLSRAAELIESA